MPARKLVAPLVIDLHNADIRGVLIDWSVTLDGTIVVLTAKRMPLYRDKRRDGGASFQRISPRPNHFAVHIIRNGAAHTVPLPPTTENFNNARLLNDDRLLLIRGRRREGETLNGAFFSLAGKARGRINIGDLPQHTFVAPDNSLWIGYGDEAFMSPLSHGGGIVRLSASGRILFSLNNARIACMDSYAMTMQADGTVHTVCYPDFPLVSISLRGRVRSRPPGAANASHTLAIRGSRALIDGGYFNHSNLYLRNLTTGTRQRVIPTTERGRTIRETSRFSINSTVYLLEKTAIHALHVPSAGQTSRLPARSR